MAQRNRSLSTKPGQSRQVLTLTHPNAAGIDIGSASHFVAVPPDRDDEPVREFKSFTVDLNALADWLQACGIDTVAMESTGVYWIPLYELLDRRGFTVLLVNARHVKNVSGRKSDVLDCQWLQQLMTYGLLRGAFRPADTVCALRSLSRQREMLLRSQGRQVQHMQKALERAAQGLTCKTAVHICYGYGIQANVDWKHTLGDEWRQYEQVFPALAKSRIDQVSLECIHSHVPAELMARIAERLLSYEGISVVMAVQPLALGLPMQEVLASADAALARAEAREPYSIEFGAAHASPAQLSGEQAWRLAMRQALGEGRAMLGEFPVIGRDGQVLHLESPLRLQLVAGGPYEVAAHWLPHALRAGLMPEIDLCALDLALRALSADGQPRCVSLSPVSLLTTGFLARLLSRLREIGPTASRLCLEVDALQIALHPYALVELGRQVRPLGVRVGLEHAGERVPDFALAAQAGIDYVKLSPSLVHELADQPARVQFVRGLISTLRGLGLQVGAEGVSRAEDLVLVRELGFDTWTGPAVRA